MAQLDVKDLCARGDAAKAKKDVWTPMLRDAYALVLPMRNPYDTDKGSKGQVIDRMYESTAMYSTFKAANRMLLEWVPPDQVWCDLKPGPVMEMMYAGQEKQLEQLKEYLGKIVRIMTMVFSSGSFTSAIHEAFLDLITAGIGVMLVLENPSSDTEPAIFESVAQNEVYIEEGAGGVIDGVYRDRSNVKVRKIKDIWEDAEIPDEMQKMIDGQTKKKEAEVDLLEVTYKDRQTGKWNYEVLWKKGGDHDPVRIVERLYDTNPWIVFRWSKVPGSPYGPGPVMMALPDIKTINAVMMMVLKNAALALSGTYLAADDGVINPENVVLSPGGIIPVASTGGSLGASLAPLQTGREFNVGQIVLKDLRVQIKKALLDNGLPPMEGNVRSATEIIQRMRELTQELGGAMGRLTNELIVPLVQRVADILARRGFIPQSININQYLVKVQVNSPLARAQQMQDVERVIQWLEICMQIGGVDGMAMAAKVEEILPWVADRIGVPDELVRDEDERGAMKQYVAEIIAMQQAQASNDMVPMAQAA